MGRYCCTCGGKLVGGIVPTTCKYPVSELEYRKCECDCEKECKSTRDCRKCPDCVKNCDCADPSHFYYSCVECFCKSCWEELFKDTFEPVKHKYFRKLEDGSSVEETEIMYRKVPTTPVCKYCENPFDIKKYRGY